MMRNKSEDGSTLMRRLVYGACVSLIAVGLALLIVAFATGYRTAEGQSLLGWSSIVLAAGSVTAVVVLVFARARLAGPRHDR